MFLPRDLQRTLELRERLSTPMPATAAYSSGTTRSGTCSTTWSSAVRAAVFRREQSSLSEGRLSSLQRQQDFIRLYLKGKQKN